MARMLALVHGAYGTVPEDVLRLEEMDKPTVADEQVLVRVHAASVDEGTGTSWLVCRLTDGRIRIRSAI